MIIVALAAFAVVLVGVLVALRTLTGAVASLQASVDDLAGNAATLDDLRAAVAAPLPERSEEQAPATSRVPSALRTAPVIKALAFGSGTAHAARRLRSGGPSNGNGKAR